MKHSHLAVKQPRDIKQVENIRSSILARQRLLHDSILNLHDLAIDMPDFFHSIHTHPDLVCVCGQKDNIDEMDRVLLLPSPSHQLLSYDTWEICMYLYYHSDMFILKKIQLYLLHLFCTSENSKQCMSIFLRCVASCHQPFQKLPTQL